ncbi:hypothetical protein LTR54_017537 [Friedmanniomyces endolithicus]|nr:hypothetical protein LTR54_017537 [Friedmanniomyces endolithicus]
MAAYGDTTQPVQIYNAPPGSGLNPWKVIIVLEELSVPYYITWVSYSDIKAEPYISINPNGRLPSIKDPNTGITLFESGACIQYLVSHYHTEYKLSYNASQDVQEYWACNSWLHFQMSGQGPMFGQKMWFTHFHKEKELTTNLERYGDEVKRIIGVIDAHLRKQRRQSERHVWLVGNVCTYADIAFIPWDLLLLVRLFPDGDLGAEQQFPTFYEWHQRVISRPAVRKVIGMREECTRTMDDTATAVIEKQNAK